MKKIGKKNLFRGGIYWVNLDPTIGTETKKQRPCVIVSNDFMNQEFPRVIIVPITSNASKIYPNESPISLLGKKGKVMLDQIRVVDKTRIGDFIAEIRSEEFRLLETSLKEVLSLV